MMSSVVVALVSSHFSSDALPLSTCAANNGDHYWVILCGLVCLTSEVSY